MLVTMLKGKIHRAVVKQAELNYVGSITVDKELMEAAGIYEYEYVQIVDVENGNRFETYTIAGEPGSGMICLNGAAARQVAVGDHIIIMACKAPKLIAPAMNTNMFENPIVQDNLSKLKHFGYEIIQPAVGYLACGDTGAGKLPSEEYLMAHIMKHLHYEKDLLGKKVLVTAGPTVESIDPVQFISNHSTGKMGYTIAKCAMERGADVILITGPTSLKAPDFVTVIPIQSAKEMFEQVKAHMTNADFIIKAAAVADYTPVHTSNEKIKKSDEDMSISLKRTDDILQYIGTHKREGQVLCGFAMETQDLIAHAQKKLEKKHADMIVANNLKVAGAGFGTDTNVITLIKSKEIKEFPLLSKDDVAKIILDEMLSFLA